MNYSFFFRMNNTTICRAIEASLKGLVINDEHLTDHEFYEVTNENYHELTYKQALGWISFYCSQICGQRVPGRVRKSLPVERL